MIDIERLNEIPRPEGWSEWGYIGYCHTSYNPQECQIVWWCPASRKLHCSSWDGHVLDMIPGFDDQDFYLRTGWLPIRTAPLDGTVVDLLAGDKRITDCHWRKAPSAISGWWREIPGGGHLLDIDDYPPTHWRLLPPLPKKPQQ